MSKRFAVAWLNYFDNDLELSVVEANTWQEALEKAKPGYVENVADAGDDMDKARELAVDQDWTFTVKEI